MNSLNRRRLLTGLAAALLGAAAPARAELPDAQDLVRRADEFRQIYKDAVYTIRLTRRQADQVAGESRLLVAVRGTEASLIRVTSGTELGQQVLMNDNGLWVKLPRSTRSLRITPLQRLMGEAAVGDIGRMRWQDDYQARLADEPETVVDGVAAWRVELTARSELATYPRVQALLAKADARPLQASFFMKSGKAVKAVQFGPVEKINDRRGIRQMEFRDLVRTDNRTAMLIEQADPHGLPARLFALESLGDWQ
jgi:Outer membrane lipoprotein-sorting protein